MHFKGFREISKENIKGLQGFDGLWIDEAQSITQETLDVIKMAIRVKLDSMLGRNYKHYSEDKVRDLFPKPDNDKTYKLVYVEEINDIILVGY